MGDDGAALSRPKLVSPADPAVAQADTPAAASRGLAPTFTEHKDGFNARDLETGFGVSLLMERAKHSLGSRAKPGGIHVYRYHWRRIGWRDARASLTESWRGRDLGSTQSRRSTSVATQEARQSACPSRKSYPRVAMMQSEQNWCGNNRS